MWARCGQCSMLFWRKESYQRKCIVCFKRDKGWKMTASDEELERIRPMYENKILHARLFTEAPSQAEGIDQGMVRELIKLCHPDRHKNSENSNKVTSWLLEQRE